MNCPPKNPAVKRYTRRSIVAMTVYMLAIFAVAEIFSRYHAGGATAYSLAMFPALPILVMILCVGLYLADERDEFQRNLFIQAMVCGIGATLAVTTVWGSLEDFASVRHLSPFWIFPMYWFFVGISTAVLSRRYR